jgi:hypothetical protein
MTSSNRLAAWLIGCAVLCSLTPLMVASASQSAATDAPIPTPLEEAIIEHACGALHPAGAPESDAYVTCRTNQLQDLRTEFGRDLRRLSGAERRAIDSACAGLREPRGQDVYVECVTTRLAALRGRGSRARPDGSGADAVASPMNPAVGAPAPSATPPAAMSPMWIAAAVIAVVAIGGGSALVITRRRHSFGVCRSCGVKMVEAGDLCQTCRHDAAEALRRAAAERVEHARVEAEEQRRSTERQQEQREQQERDAEARLRQVEHEQTRRAQQQADAQRQRDEEAAQRRQVDAAAGEDEFDPHVVLGVPVDASAADVDAAYQAARLKYDAEAVSGLGNELQEHFGRKAAAVERAYQILVTRRSP